MSKIVIYRKSNGEFVFDGYVTPAGTWRKKEETSPGSINFREVGALADRFPQSIYITDVVNESGTPYATIAAFDAEMDGFFVKAPGGGTGATDLLGGIAHDAAAPTPGVSGKYYFTSAGVVSWISGTPTVSIGDEVIVVYASGVHSYTHLSVWEIKGELEDIRDETVAAWDNFDDTYLGAKATDPTVDNDGGVLKVGAMYFNSVSKIFKVWDGSAWITHPSLESARSQSTTKAPTSKLLDDELTAVDDSLAQLAGELSEKADLHKVVSGNLYDKTKVISGYFINPTTGVLSSSETSKVSPLIPVTPDTIYFLFRTNLGTAEVRFLESDMITPIKPIDVLTGLPYTNYTTGTSSKAIKSPSNAAYFQFTVVFNGTGNPDTAQFKEGVSYSVYEEYTERQEVSPVNLPVLPLMKIEKGKNLFDKTKVVSGYYLSDSGSIGDNSTSKISGLIDIIPGKTYYLTRTTTGANNIRFVKADGTPLKPLNPISGDEFGYVTSASVAVKAPPLAKYFQFTVVFVGTGNPDTAQFEEGSIGTVYEEYTERQVLPLDNTAKEIIELLQITNAEINPLKGKSVTFNGDSIGSGAPGAEGAYGAIIAGRNSMVYENKSVGGATITAEQYSAGNPRHWISRTISEMNENADYIILEGGVNDAALSVPFGTISNGYTDTLDDTTFCGAFESMLKQSVLRWKGKKIGFIIVHRIATGLWTTTYQTAIWEMCKKWGIPVCDLFNKIPSLERISELKTIYTYNSDGWHPNALGYQKYYCDKIEAWMKTL